MCLASHWQPYINVCIQCQCQCIYHISALVDLIMILGAGGGAGWGGIITYSQLKIWDKEKTKDILHCINCDRTTHGYS